MCIFQNKLNFLERFKKSYCVYHTINLIKLEFQICLNWRWCRVSDNTWNLLEVNIRCIVLIVYQHQKLSLSNMVPCNDQKSFCYKWKTETVSRVSDSCIVRHVFHCTLNQIQNKWKSWFNQKNIRFLVVIISLTFYSLSDFKQFVLLPSHLQPTHPSPNQFHFLIAW